MKFWSANTFFVDQYLVDYLGAALLEMKKREMRLRKLFAVNIHTYLEITEFL